MKPQISQVLRNKKCKESAMTTIMLSETLYIQTREHYAAIKSMLLKREEIVEEWVEATLTSSQDQSVITTIL